VRRTLYCEGESAPESFRATPIRATVYQSGYRIFQLKNPFIPDFALSENGAVRRYSLQWASGFAGSRARNAQTRDNGPAAARMSVVGGPLY